MRTEMLEMFKALVNEAKTLSTGKELYEAENWVALEEGYAQYVYETVEEETGLFLEPSVKPEYGTGVVVALKDGGEGEEVARYAFEDELELMLGILKGITGEITEDSFNEAVAECVAVIKQWIQ